MPFPFLILLGMSGIAVALGGCAGIDLQTPAGQCEVAKDAKLVAESEGMDADMLRRADLAIALSCPAVD